MTLKRWQYDEVDGSRLLLHVEAGGRSVSFTSLCQMVCVTCRVSVHGDRRHPTMRFRSSFLLSFAFLPFLMSEHNDAIVPPVLHVVLSEDREEGRKLRLYLTSPLICETVSRSSGVGWRKLQPGPPWTSEELITRRVMEVLRDALRDIGRT